jgi:hypothetical protein
MYLQIRLLQQFRISVKAPFLPHKLISTFLTNLMQFFVNLIQLAFTRPKLLFSMKRHKKSLRAWSF